MNYLKENEKTFSEELPVRKTKHIKKFYIIGITILLLILIVVYFSFTYFYKNITLKTYSDPLHYFTITIPKNWDTDQEEGSNTTGLNTQHPILQKIEISQMSLSSQEGITVQVYEGTPSCPLDLSLNTTIAGFPAEYNSTLQTWTIPTTKSTVIVSVSYPGGNVTHTGPSQIAATPVPPSVVEKNKEYIMGILNTLKLTSLSPFNCH